MKRNAKVKKMRPMIIVFVEVEGELGYKELIRIEKAGETIDISAEDLQDSLVPGLIKMFRGGVVIKAALEGPSKIQKSTPSVKIPVNKPPKKPGPSGKGDPNGAN